MPAVAERKERRASHHRPGSPYRGPQRPASPSWAKDLPRSKSS